MKTVWIIDHYSSQPKYGGISRQYDFAMELAKRNYKVIVIASTFSHYTHSYISNKNIHMEKIVNNAYYVYLKTHAYSSNNGIQRALSMFSFYHTVLHNYSTIANRFGKPDVVEGCSVHPLTWVAAQKIAKRFNVPFVAEVRDLWPEMWLLNGEKSNLDPMVIFFGTIEKWAYKKSNKIIYSMLYGDKYLCDKLGISRNKITLIGQPLDCERYDRNASDNIKLIPAEILSFTKNSFVCVFTGYYMEYEGVYVMLEAAKICSERNIPIKMVFVGSGAEKDGMIEYSKKHSLKNVYIGDRISKEAIPALLRLSDVCLAHCANRSHEEAFKYGISKNKVNEYMYSNSCVIYGRNDSNDPVATSGAGFVIKPFDAVAMADIIEKLYNMSFEERKKYGENGRKYAIANHRVDKLTDKLLRAYGFITEEE